jgi:hypothetical protein
VSTLPSASWRCLSLQLRLSATSLAFLRGQSVLRWSVPPQCQHTCRLFLHLSVGRDHFNTVAVSASVTGTSSRPRRST